MIWIWLGLAIIPTVALLIVVDLLVDRWWHRREARKHAEALARFKASDPYQRLVRDFTATMTAVGEQMRPALTSFAAAANRVAPELEQIAAAVKATDLDPDSPEGTPNA